jgi:hypothetical protein
VRKRSATDGLRINWSTVEIIDPLALVPDPPAHQRIKPGAFAAYEGQTPTARILSGAVEIARHRGASHTHRELCEIFEGGVECLAYWLALVIATASGPIRAPSLCATVIQIAGALATLRLADQKSNVALEAHKVLQEALCL